MLTLPTGNPGIGIDGAEAAVKAGWEPFNIGLLDYLCKAKGYEFLGTVASHLIVGRQPGLKFIAYKDMLVNNWNCSFFNEELIAYCDGSGTVKDNLAGSGVAIFYPDTEPKLIAKNIGLGTNNRAELTAIKLALRNIPCIQQKILIRSDSEYALKACFEHQAINVNYDLITEIRLDLAVRKGNVRYEHVRGHKGDPGNELADALAGWARKYGHLKIEATATQPS